MCGNRNAFQPVDYFIDRADRLMHHAHVVITTGDSIRLTQATRGKGVRPLAN